MKTKPEDGFVYGLLFASLFWLTVGAGVLVSVLLH